MNPTDTPAESISLPKAIVMELIESALNDLRFKDKITVVDADWVGPLMKIEYVYGGKE